jgi:hypothetical protein
MPGQAMPGQVPLGQAAPPAAQPSYLPPGASAPPLGAPPLGADVPPDRDEVHWFARIGLGVGPRGVSSNNALLDEVGYTAVKMWVELDAAYMFHRRVGVGVWMGMNRRSGQPAEGQGSKLNAAAYFIGVEVPILLWGERDYALQLVPRGGFLSGEIELDNFEEAPFQKTGIFGAGVTFNSFTYHVGGGIAYTYAPAGSVSELGRTHDYGGFCVMLQGSIDG